MRIIDKITLEGVGLHTGKTCRLEIEPFDTDEVMMSCGKSEALISRMKTRGTNRGSDYIFPDGNEIRTCEHVLSSLTGLGIFSGVRVKVDGGEMPAFDGCAWTLSREIIAHSDDTVTKAPTVINSPVIVSNEDRTRFIAAFPSDTLHITYTVEYDYIGTQIYDYTHNAKNYVDEISRARTFAMKSDIDYLRSHGMALGGSLDNAIAVGETIEAKGGLHWENEFVRHKVLDLIGDLASLGKPVNAHIVAVRAGHELHLKLAEKLKEETIKNGRD